MEKSLTKHGNSLALIIDKPILELLNISASTPLSVTTNGEELIVRPIFDLKTDREKTINLALNEVNRQYKKTLKKLNE